MFVKHKKRVLNIIGIAIMVTAVMLAAFSDKIGLIESIIADTDQNEIPTGITLHFFIILIILLASNACFFFAENNKSKMGNLFFSKNLFYPVYLIVSIFFSLSTGYAARVRHLSEFMENIAEAPYWYSAEIMTLGLKESIYRKINQMSTFSVLTWLLTILGIALLILMKNKSVLCLIKQYVRKLNTRLFEEQKTSSSVASAEETDRSVGTDAPNPIISTLKDKNLAPNASETELPTKYSLLNIKKTTRETASCSQPEKTRESSGVCYIEELKQLKKLRDAEILTQEEFEAKKKQLLDI